MTRAELVEDLVKKSICQSVYYSALGLEKLAALRLAKAATYFRIAGLYGCAAATAVFVGTLHKYREAK